MNTHPNRTRHRIARAALALAVAGALPATAAFGYAQLYPARAWTSTPVPVVINSRQAEGSITDGDNGYTAVLDALNDPTHGWNSVVGSDLVDGITANGAAVQGDGEPTIEFNDPINICTGGCLAATLTGYYHNAPGLEVIDDADVYVDAQASFTSENEDTVASCSNNEFFIEGTLQHEVGHVLGLGHSNRARSTMYAYANPCDNGLDELARDDRNGISTLY